MHSLAGLFGQEVEHSSISVHIFNFKRRKFPFAFLFLGIPRQFLTTGRDIQDQSFQLQIAKVPRVVEESH